MFHHDGETVEVGQGRGRRLEHVGVRHELEDEVTIGERPQDVGARHPHRAAHRADPPEPGRLHLLVEQALGVGDRVLGHDPADDGVGVTRRLRQLLQVCGLRAEWGAVAAATWYELTTFQFDDSAKYVGWSNSRHIPEMSPMSSSR